MKVGGAIVEVQGVVPTHLPGIFPAIAGLCSFHEAPNPPGAASSHPRTLRIPPISARHVRALAHSAQNLSLPAESPHGRTRALGPTAPPNPLAASTKLPSPPGSQISHSLQNPNIWPYCSPLAPLCSFHEASKPSRLQIPLLPKNPNTWRYCIGPSPPQTLGIRRTTSVSRASP